LRFLKSPYIFSTSIEILRQWLQAWIWHWLKFVDDIVRIVLTVARWIERFKIIWVLASHSRVKYFFFCIISSVVEGFFDDNSSSVAKRPLVPGASRYGPRDFRGKKIQRTPDGISGL
jgi:hypothetical protein